jgi:SAM-dependent methyltransferase
MAEQPGSLECLEVGAGPGGPSLWLAAQGHHVVCSNQSDSESLARPLHSRYPGVTTIEYRDIDILQIPWVEHFDVIVFKSVIGGIHPGGSPAQLKAMSQIRAALKPGGVLLFAENVRGTWFHRLARAIAFRRRSAPWLYPTIRQMRQLLDGFSSYELRSTGVLALFGPRESSRALLSRADATAFNHLVPASWKYVAYGSAIK